MHGDAFEHLSRTFDAIAGGRNCRRILESATTRPQIGPAVPSQPDGAVDNEVAAHLRLAALAEGREAGLDRSAESLHCESNNSSPRLHSAPVAPGGDSWTLIASTD